MDIIAATPAEPSGAPLPAPGRKIPGNHGIWVGICCEFVEFLLLFLVYFIARAHFPDEFHAGTQRLSLAAGIIITLVMVTSSFFIACSVTSLRAGRRRHSLWWLLAALLTAVGYPVSKYLEIQWNFAHGIHGESGIFFTTYYYLTLTHMVHVFWGILGFLWVIGRHVSGIYTPEEHDGLEALASYWHATDIIWLVIFPFCYVLA